MLIKKNKFHKHAFFTQNIKQLIITESGIHTSDDVKKMNDCGINTFLVGESLMTAEDPINKFREIFTK